MSTIHHTVIVGTGFSGIAMGIQLKKAGIDDFIILERAGDVGGTWRDNTYPGAACDVPSHLYSFSFEPNKKWSRSFSPQPEILEYIKNCARKYGIYEHIRFNSNVASATYDAAHGRWSVATDDATIHVGRTFVIGTGGLSRPVYPNIPGLKEFKGALFHSAAWNHEASLDNKRVAVIGTGASAIQIVPAIAAKVAKLHLFQRSGAWVLPKQDKAYSRWQMALKVHVPWFERLMRAMIYWRLELFGLGLRYPKIMEWAKKGFLGWIAKNVRDESLRQKLTPQYTPGCKRILFSDDFYPAVTRHNVEVVTTAIQKVSGNTVVTSDGQSYEVDALICATGFQAADSPSPFPIYGKGRQQLADTWANGAEAYRGCVVPGFPNMFIVTGPNTGLGHTSMVLIIEAAVGYIVGAIKNMQNKSLKSMEIEASRSNAYNTDLAAKLKGMVWAQGGCMSWYNTTEGKNVTLYPRSTIAFKAMLWSFDLASYQVEVLEEKATAGESEATAPIIEGLSAY